MVTLQGLIFLITKGSTHMFSWFKRDTPEVANAKALLKAIDRGGIPSNPVKVNDIARKIGLSVAPLAPMQETILRIRSELKSR